MLVEGGERAQCSAHARKANSINKINKGGLPCLWKKVDMLTWSITLCSDQENTHSKNIFQNLPVKKGGHVDVVHHAVQ